MIRVAKARMNSFWGCGFKVAPQGLVFNSKTKSVRRESDIKKVLKEGQYTNVHHSYDDDHRLK